MMTRLICTIKYTGPETVKMHIGGRARQTRARQANVDSVSQQLVSSYEFLATELSGADRAVYGRESRAKNQSND